jgi:cytochrome c oxidase subunit IV
MSDSHTPATTSPTADAHAAEAHHDHAHDVAKHVKGYLMVGGLLIVFTGITVALSYLDFDEWFGVHGSNFVIAMIVATFKAGLVAAIFMHLKGEKWMIWKFLLFTAFFCAGLFFLTLLHWIDPIFGTHHATQY